MEVNEEKDEFKPRRVLGVKTTDPKEYKALTQALVKGKEETLSCDIFTVTLEAENNNIQLDFKTANAENDEKKQSVKFSTMSLKFGTTFYPYSGGVSFDVGGNVFSIEYDDSGTDEKWVELREFLIKSNHHNNFIPPEHVKIELEQKENEIIARAQSQNAKKKIGAKALKSVLKSNTYPIQTGQEFDALICSAAGPKSRQYWNLDGHHDKIVFKHPHNKHHVEIPKGDYEKETLLDFIDSKNSDFALALSYVGYVIAGIPGAGKGEILGGWIDILDVMTKIGWMREKPSGERLRELQAQMWGFLVYGEEAVVTGERSIPYKDHRNKIIDTRISSAAWRITDEQRPVAQQLDLGLGDGPKPTPVAAHIVISKQWEPLFTHPSLAQYFPLGELLGQIPPHKVAGDWARIIGLNLLRAWRMKPREAMAGTLNPTRRELLTHYLPKTKSAEELLEGDHPKRAVQYYLDALEMLRTQGIIAASGDAALKNTVEKTMTPYVKQSRQGWGGRWFSDKSNIQFGWQAMLPIARCADSLAPLSAPKPLNEAAKKPRKRR